jgi:DNA-directed RNA polymerase specialized sigma24 family protein
MPGKAKYSDDELVERILHGDDVSRIKAANALYETCKKVRIAKSLRRGLAPSLQDDLHIEAMQKLFLYINRGNFKQGEKVAPLFQRILNNTVIDYHRSKEAKQSKSMYSIHDEDLFSLEYDKRFAADTRFAIINDEELRKRLDKFIKDCLKKAEKISRAIDLFLHGGDPEEIRKEWKMKGKNSVPNEKSKLKRQLIACGKKDPDSWEFFSSYFGA